MNAKDYELMTEAVKKMRAERRAYLERSGWREGTPNRAFVDGEINGLTRVLEYICPNPHEG